MPRTKVTKKDASKASKNNTDSKDIDAEVKLKIKHLVEFMEQKIKFLRTTVPIMIEKNIMERRMRLPPHMLNTTLGEIKQMTSLPLNTTSLLSTESRIDILNGTKTVTKKKSLSRSSSLDEGYLTTSSSNSVDRTSHARNRLKKTTKATENKRRTRSLSRNVPAKTAHTLSTPSDKGIPPNSYGIITPKCKPNTAHVLLRRPKRGEMALSFQGSPLLTAPVATEDVANVNIPLDDGTLLSLQPQRGLRLSQLPELDTDTLQQLKMLNEHIAMVLKATECDE